MPIKIWCINSCSTNKGQINSKNKVTLVKVLMTYFFLMTYFLIMGSHYATRIKIFKNYKSIFGSKGNKYLKISNCLIIIIIIITTTLNFWKHESFPNACDIFFFFKFCKHLLSGLNILPIFSQDYFYGWTINFWIWGFIMGKTSRPRTPII